MKKIVSVLAFGILFVILFNSANEVFVEKYLNRYYMLSKELEKIDDIDVQVYGSCHSYTSFDALYFEDTYKVSAYDMGNPGEIIPTTYLRMFERFKQDKPKVALVEIWGLNAYETYASTEKILDYYLRSNIEDIPISIEKMKVINDFQSLDAIEDSFAVAKYKDRLLDFSLTEIDFNYSFEKANEMYNSDNSLYSYNEMEIRLANNGFLSNYSTDVSDYDKLQSKVEENEILEVEADLMKYVDKIIQLCQESDVKLIFYRAPYRSTANELRKVNFLETYLADKNVLFFDLEREIEYDYEKDFHDYEHLSEMGALKSTQYLGERIMDVLQ